MDRQAAGSIIVVMSFLFGLGLACLLLLRLIIAVLAAIFG